jgi:hypothetical protein
MEECQVDMLTFRDSWVLTRLEYRNGRSRPLAPIPPDGDRVFTDMNKKINPYYLASVPDECHASPDELPRIRERLARDLPGEFAFATREERHYCALLFRWLLSDPRRIERFVALLASKGCNATVEPRSTRIVFEFSYLRDLLHGLDRREFNRKNAKHQMNSAMSGSSVDHKRIDLALLCANSKSVVLIEAKFDGAIDKPQLTLTRQYGEILGQLWSCDVHYVYLYLHGESAHDDAGAYVNITWSEVLAMLRAEPESSRDALFQTELAAGLRLYL